VSHSSRAPLALAQPESWWLLAVEGQESSPLAPAPLAVPGFFAGWIALGVIVALRLARRGHDRRTMMAVGAGLGPLMVLLASDIVRWREREASPLVLEPGVDHGGDLDVLVLVQDRPEDVRSVLPTLEAVVPDLARLTVARVVDFEWLEGDLDNEVVAAASSALFEATALLPIEGAGRVLHPGTLATVADRFTAQPDRTLVLFAIGESAAGPAAPGPG
jgi:hypothetical protein